MRVFLRRFTLVYVLAAAASAGAQRVPPQRSLAQELDSYEPGRTDVPAIAYAALFSGAGEFRRDAAAWITTGAAPDAPRRRLVVSTYVLDMLKDVEDQRIWQDTQAASTLVEWACARLRESPPLPAERAWHVAALALLERSSTDTVLERHLEHAETRVPDGDRWPLVRVLLDEWRSQRNRRDDGTLVVSDGQVGRAVQHFQQASHIASVRQEALLRWAAYESDLGRPDAALSGLGEIGALTDPFLRYWLGLVKGRALMRTNRPQEAAAAYGAAVQELPSGQSAALGLATALAGMKRMSEASGVVARVLAESERATVPDPWTMYGAPDVRFWPRALDEIRAAVKP